MGIDKKFRQKQLYPLTRTRRAGGKEHFLIMPNISEDRGETRFLASYVCFYLCVVYSFTFYLIEVTKEAMMNTPTVISSAQALNIQQGTSPAK